MEGKSLRKFFPVSLLRKGRSCPLLAARQVVRPNIAEADGSRWFTGFIGIKESKSQDLTIQTLSNVMGKKARDVEVVLKAVWTTGNGG